MKKIIVLVLVIVSVCVIMYLPVQITKRNNILIKERNRLNKTNDSLIKVVDSLKSDIFVKDIQLGRYEYILDRAEDEMSPNCRKELEKIYGQTE